MKYEEYMKLGFKRTELGCAVEFNKTGYGGFALELRLKEELFISVTSPELNEPKLYIQKSDCDIVYHIIPIKVEVMKDLINILKKKK